jgi:hypothetical protein
VERGRGDLVLLAIERSWGTWRGRAVEPVIHDALLRIAPDLGFPGAAAGSVKWHETRPFGLREYNDLIRGVHSVPGVSDQTTLLAVTRTAEVADGVPIRCLGPTDLLTAWAG